jgi:hypothetical protein
MGNGEPGEAVFCKEQAGSPSPNQLDERLGLILASGTEVAEFSDTVLKNASASKLAVRLSHRIDLPCGNLRYARCEGYCEVAYSAIFDRILNGLLQDSEQTE